MTETPSKPQQCQIYLPSGRNELKDYRINAARMSRQFLLNIISMHAREAYAWDAQLERRERLLELLVAGESIGTYSSLGIALKGHFGKAKPPSLHINSSASVGLKAMVEEPPRWKGYTGRRQKICLILNVDLINMQCRTVKTKSILPRLPQKQSRCESSQSLGS